MCGYLMLMPTAATERAYEMCYYTNKSSMMISSWLSMSKLEVGLTFSRDVFHFSFNIVCRCFLCSSISYSRKGHIRRSLGIPASDFLFPVVDVVTAVENQNLEFIRVKELR